MNERITSKLPASAIGTAVLVAAVWGFNFVVIKVGVSGVPPLMLAALRFVFCVFPAIFFVKRPAVPWKSLAAYGLSLGVGEFGLLFTAIKLGAPAGLASILLQSQAFFTALLAAVFLREKLRAPSVAGLALAAAGLALFSLGSGSGRIGLPLLFMILGAGLGWAGANVFARSMSGVNSLGLMVWSSLFSPLPLALLSLFFEGPSAIAGAFAGIGPLTIACLAYLVILSTMLGYGLWNSLILRHGAARIAPFSLMVPVFGMASAALVFGERLRPLDAAGSALIALGLLVHVFGPRLALREQGGRAGVPAAAPGPESRSSDGKPGQDPRPGSL
jgi:O-acetylserine/cysteine efflux transporter